MTRLGSCRLPRLLTEARNDEEGKGRRLAMTRIGFAMTKEKSREMKELRGAHYYKAKVAPKTKGTKVVSNGKRKVALNNKGARSMLYIKRQGISPAFFITKELHL